MPSTDTSQKETNEKIKSAYEKAMERLDTEQNSENAEDTTPTHAESPEVTATQDAESTEAAEETNAAEAPPEEEKEVKEVSVEAVEDDSNAVNLDYKDKYLRSCAELENFRMRVKRDKENWRANSIRSFAMSFIDILDNLNLALTATLASKDSNDPNFVKGVTAVRDQFKNQLTQRGIKQIEVKSGDVFDADAHEILLVQESSDVEGQVVGAILRPGYMLDKTVLRPAQIQVIKGV
jgi:molecular chaperone GrpE